MASCRVSWLGCTGVLLCTVLMFNKGAALDLTGKPTSQSSTLGSFDSSLAVDGNRNTYSHTSCRSNQYWLIDLQEIYCLTKITIVNRQDCCNWRLEGAVVRAGMNGIADHTQNAMIGSPVMQSQATNGRIIEFVSGGVFMAQYVSVDLPTENCLHLAEVNIKEIVDTVQTTITTGVSLDLTVVVDPAVIGATGDDDAVMAVYKGPDAITAGVSFGRQLTTDQGTNELPSGSVGKSDQSLGCQTRLLTLPESAGLDRTGVFYAVASTNDVTTKIQTIILPNDQGAIHVSPVKRTQIANAGDTVLLQMRNMNSPDTDYRWRHNGGDVITSWNGQLDATVMNVSATDEGVYTCFAQGYENDQLHGIMRLIVRDCPEGVWGPSCLKPCRRCYNGGICDDQTGSCTCPPGFSGESCERVQGRDVFGKNASHSCSNGPDPHSTDCQGRLFCLPDPYGCSCAAGYKGLDCTQECDEGFFGADCQQTCNCVQGDTCLKDTGECTGECQPTFSGENCQCSTGLATLGFTVVSVDTHQLKVSWQPDPCTIGHKLQYELVKRGIYEVIEDPQRMLVNVNEGVTQYDLTGLESCSVYSVFIQPRYNNGYGPSVLKSIQTLPGEPTTVAPLMWTSGSPTSITLMWSSVSCSDYYYVQYAVINRYGCEPIDNVEYIQHCMCLGNQNTTVISGLTANSRYKVKVQARVDNIPTNITELQDILTSTAEPSTPPENVVISSISQRSLSFTWTKPVCSGRGGVITMYGYQLRRGSDAIQILTPEESVTIFDLIPFTNYTFKVAAHTSAGGGPFSQDLVVRTNEAEPTVPLNVRIQDVDDTSISLTWSRPDPPHGIITQYNVRYGKMGETNNSLVVNGIKQLEYTIGGLDTNVTYSFQVQAETSVGAGPWSDAITETTRKEVTWIIGVVTAVVVVLVCLIALALILCVLWRRRKNHHLSDNPTAPDTMELALSDQPKEVSDGVDSPSPAITSYNDDDANVYEDVCLPEWAVKWAVDWKDLTVEDKVLGKGNFGEVRAATINIKGTATKAAVKTLKGGASETDTEDFMAEFKIISRIGKHPNIVGLLGACLHEAILYVALEFLPNGNLRDYLRKTRPKQLGVDRQSVASTLTSSELLSFAIDVATGMEHLSAIGIIHRDLAARNVLLAEDKTAKVSDFGLSRGEDLYVQKSMTRVPSRWLAIESLTQRMYKTKSDVWSFAILLWEIVTYGATPYPGILTQSLAKRLLDGYRMPKPENCAEEIYDLMLQCWQRSPSQRPDFTQIKEALTLMNDNSDEKMYLSPTVYQNFLIKRELDDN